VKEKAPLEGLFKQVLAETRAARRSDDIGGAKDESDRKKYQMLIHSPLQVCPSSNSLRQVC